MKSRNLVILAVVVAAVAAYIFLYERHQLTSEEARERAGKVFPDLDRDTVATVEIRNSHGEFVLTKSGEDWRLSEPIDFPADTPAINSVLSSLTNLSEERRLSADEVNPAAYGLDEPELGVVISTDDGLRFELEVGEETPLGSNRAVRRGGVEDIILCRGWFVTDLDKELDDWRSRDVVDVTADEVASLQLVAGPDRIHAVRDGEEWRLLEPVVDLADRDHVRNLISSLNSLRIEEFLHQETDPVDLGLDEPEYRITLIRTEGAEPVQLDFGSSRDEDGSTHVACRRDGSDLFWVNDVAATPLAKAPIRWRSGKVYGFDTWDAERFAIETDGGQLRLDRSEGLWKAPDGGELDYSAVQDRLSKLANLEAIEYDLVEPVTEHMGRVELALEAAADDEEAEPVSISYSFFRPLTDGGDAIVTVSARETVMSVDVAEAEAILADPDSLRKEEEPDLEEQSEQDENAE
jgi:hypothetical protein